MGCRVIEVNESTFIKNTMDGISHLLEGAYPIKHPNKPTPHFYMYDHPTLLKL